MAYKMKLVALGLTVTTAVALGTGLGNLWPQLLTSPSSTPAVTPERHVVVRTAEEQQEYDACINRGGWPLDKAVAGKSCSEP